MSSLYELLPFPVVLRVDYVVVVEKARRALTVSRHPLLSNSLLSYGLWWRVQSCLVFLAGRAQLQGGSIRAAQPKGGSNIPRWLSTAPASTRRAGGAGGGPTKRHTCTRSPRGRPRRPRTGPARSSCKAAHCAPGGRSRRRRRRGRSSTRSSSGCQ